MYHCKYYYTHTSAVCDNSCIWSKSLVWLFISFPRGHLITLSLKRWGRRRGEKWLDIGALHRKSTLPSWMSEAPSGCRGWSVVFEVPDVNRWLSLLPGYCLISSSVRRRERVLHQVSSPVELVCESCSTLRTDWDVVVMRHKACCFTKESFARKEANWLCCTYTQSGISAQNELLTYYNISVRTPASRFDLIKHQCCFLSLIGHFTIRILSHTQSFKTVWAYSSKTTKHPVCNIFFLISCCKYLKQLWNCETVFWNYLLTKHVLSIQLWCSL